MPIFDTIFIILATLIVGSLTLFYIMWSDIKSFRIPNIATLILFLSSILFAFATNDFEWISHLACFVLVFGVCYALFHFEFLGGGDTKLIPVMAFWVGFADILPFLLMMTGVGAVLAIVMAVVSAIRARALSANEETKTAWRKKRMPYGVAIGVAGILFFAKTGFAILG